MTFELSPQQILILGAVASALVFIFRLVAEVLAKNKISLPTWVNNLIVFAVALVLGLLWTPAVFPPLPMPSGDPSIDIPQYLVYLGSVLAVLTGALSFAVFIYNYLIIKLKTPLRHVFNVK